MIYAHAPDEALWHIAVSCDLEDGDRYCACGACMVRTDCICEDGYTAYGQLHEMDPLWYDEDDIRPCHECGGDGGWWVCPEGPDGESLR